MFPCPKCGGNQWFGHSLFCPGESNGIGSTASPSHGSSDPAQGIGPGTTALVTASAFTPAHIHALYAQFSAQQNSRALPGLGWLGAQNMGAVGFQAGGLMQPHPLGALATPSHIAPSPPLETAPISVGEFVGWRVWRVRTRERLLLSYSADAIWLPGEPMEGKPTDHGHEGVWAFKDRLRAANKLNELGSGGAIGSVWLWGNVVEHGDGYRGEFAEIRSIDGAPSGPIEYMRNEYENGTVTRWKDNDELLAALRARYGVGSAEDAGNGAPQPDVD